MGPVVVSVSAVRFPLVVGVHRAVGVDQTPRAVVLKTLGAFWAVGLQTASSLGANTNAIADLDVLYVTTDANCLANDLVTDTASS